MNHLPQNIEATAKNSFWKWALCIPNCS